MGRPPSFTKADDLEKEVKKYFVQCPKSGKIPNKAGLAVHLGISKETLNVYARGDRDDLDQGFSDVLKDAYAIIEEAWVQLLAQNKGAGPIFYLKNAFRKDYKDRTEIGIGDKKEDDFENFTTKELIQRLGEIRRIENRERDIREKAGGKETGEIHTLQLPTVSSKLAP